MGAGTDRASARSHVETALNCLEAVDDPGGAVDAPGGPIDDVGEAVDADDVTATLVRVLEDHDLVALGATREGRLRDRVVGSVAAGVARHAAPPIVIARRPAGGRVTALLSRAFHGRA